MSDPAPSGSTRAQPPRRASAGVIQVVDLETAEHLWEIFPGMVVHGYAFNGQIPGPVIEARVGDTLLVQFANLLPEPATICWHGLPESATTSASQLAADPVPPGGRLRYQLGLPDAGTFWYESAVIATAQINRGPSGVLVVRDHEEPAFDAERVLLVEKIEPDRGGQLAPPEELFGDKREVLLVNGALEPEMQIATGQVERWRLVNSTSAHLRLSLGGHPFHLIRIDNFAGQAIDEVWMAPGDRLDLAVGPYPRRGTVVLEALPYDRRLAMPAHRVLATWYITPPHELPCAARPPNR